MNIPAEQEFKNILVILIGRLGDYLVAAPFLDSIRKRYPYARMTFLTSGKAAGLARGNPAFDSVMVLDKWYKFPGNLRLLSLFKDRYDLAMDLNPSYSRTSMALTLLSAAPCRVAFEKRAPKNVYTHFVGPNPENERMADKYIRFADFFGAQRPLNTALRVVGPDAEAADAVIKGLGFEGSKPLIAIHAGNFKKTGHRWPEEKFIEFTRIISKEQAFNLFYIIGPGEEKVTFKNILAFLPGMKYVRPLPLGATAALIGRLSLLVCNNSGPLHLAAAVGVPTLSINTRYSYNIWKPSGDIHFAAVSDSWRSCRDITVGEVVGRFNTAVDVLKLPRTAGHL